MPTPIDRNVTSPSGTSVTMAGNSVAISREMRPAANEVGNNPDVKKLGDTVKAGNWDAANKGIKDLAAKLEQDPSALTKAEKKQLASVLADTAKAANKADKWEVWEIVLSILALGIPFIVDACHKNDVEKLEDAANKLRGRLGDSAGYSRVLSTSEDGDISGHMNLYVRNPLLSTASKLAEGMGGPFVKMSDAVATNHYSANRTVKPADFEVSAGVMLIEKGSRNIVSQEAGKFYTMSLDGKPVFKGADDKLYFQPADGKPAVLVPDADVSRVARKDVSNRDVGARARLPNDPDARPDMKFTWHGYSSGEVKVGWWGQCESSGMLGAMGLMPARQSVTLYDEATGGQVELSTREITSMMVFMGRANYFGTYPASRAGAINRNEDEIDSDKPIEFHNFVMRQINNGVPFNLEAHSYEQIWNYPIGKASITQGNAEELPGGGYRLPHTMELTKTNGSKVQYFYEITYDAQGNVTGSKWDMEAGERANGKSHAVPDKMKSYFGEHKTKVEFGAYSSYAQEQGFTPETIRMVGDLYFASHAKPNDGEHRIYAVRTKDGQLLQMNAAEFKKYVDDRRTAATGTDG